MTSGRKVRRLGVAAAAAALIGSASSAFAGVEGNAGTRVYSSGVDLQVQGEIHFGDQVENDIDVSLESGAYKITDAAGVWALDTPSNTCSEVSLTEATCPDPKSGLALISVWSGYMDDQVSIDAPGDVPANTILGPGTDQFQGGAERDNVNGYWGESPLESDGGDTIKGGGESDQIFGDFGVGFGGAGNDELHGEAGNDVISGDGGGDKIFGGDDNDFITGDFENYNEEDQEADTTPPGADLLDGGDGNDQIFAGPGADTVQGGPGQDEVLSHDDDEAPDDVSCGDGDGDFVLFGEGDLIGSDCEIVLLGASCPEGECEALVEVVATVPPARGAERGRPKKLVVAQDEFEFKGRKRFKVKFKPAKVDKALASSDEVGVVRKLTVKAEREKDKEATRFELARAE